MKVQCPGCGWSAEVPDEKIPVEGRTGTCPKCKTRFEVKREAEPDFVFDSVVPDQEPPTQRDTKPCPFCSEEILSVAKKCKHCGSMLDDIPNTTVLGEKNDKVKEIRADSSTIQILANKTLATFPVMMPSQILNFVFLGFSNINML